MAIFLSITGLMMGWGTAVRCEDSLLKPQLSASLQESRRNWEQTHSAYKKHLSEAMESLQKDKSRILKRLVEENLSVEERDSLLSQYKKIESEYKSLDSEEDKLLAATIVEWANRKEQVENFVGGVIDEVVPG